MKKFLLLLTILLVQLIVSGQTTLTPMASMMVKSRNVTPVKIEGDGSMFNFTHNLAPTGNCFSINFGSMVLDQCDKFVFIFAEYYQGNTNCPLYYIKRQDGKYLSFQLGGAGFVDLITTPEVRYQKWLISLPQRQTGMTKKYNFLLPLAPVEYGYILKKFDDNKIGFDDALKNLNSETNFFVNQTPKKVLSGKKNTN